MMQPVVLIENLSVKYNKKNVLDSFDLCVNSDDGIIGVFGQNGVGKTTLFKVLTNDIQVYRGQVKKPSPCNIAYLPDKPFLYGWLTVKQCVKLYASRFSDFRNDIFQDFLKGSNITQDLKVSDLSKGMSERLHIALTMARKPDMYILDEPLAAVDPHTRTKLIELIKRYKYESAPVLISTHLISGVQDLFDTVVYVNNGKVILKDRAVDLKQKGIDLEVFFKEMIENEF